MSMKRPEKPKLEVAKPPAHLKFVETLGWGKGSVYLELDVEGELRRLARSGDVVAKLGRYSLSEQGKKLVDVASDDSRMFEPPTKAARA